jgi:hypothetical protein
VKATQTSADLGQALQALHDHDPRQFWFLIGMAAGEIFLVLGIVLGIVIGGAKLKSWAAARLVAYVKRRYPNEWHLPANRRLLVWVSVFVFFVGFALVFVLLPSVVSLGLVLAMMLALLLLLFGSSIIGELERRLTMQAIHPFVPRNTSMLDLLLMLDRFRVSPDVIRACVWLRIFPTADPIEWPCRICGEPEASAKHGFPGPQKDPIQETAPSKKRRLRHEPVSGT